MRARLLLASFAVLAVLHAFTTAGCAGRAGDACAGLEECERGLLCVGPNDPIVCGSGVGPLCGSDAECPQGRVCSVVIDSCVSGGFGAECQLPCGGTTCTNGVLCNAGHACQPVPCDEGFPCSARQRCDPAAAHPSGPGVVITHGCVDIDCTDDSGCPSGKACVNGYCQDGAGVCGMEGVSARAH